MGYLQDITKEIAKSSDYLEGNKNKFLSILKENGWKFVGGNKSIFWKNGDFTFDYVIGSTTNKMGAKPSDYKQAILYSFYRNGSLIHNGKFIYLNEKELNDFRKILSKLKEHNNGYHASTN